LKRRVLIVDDNKGLGKNLSDILEFKNCKTMVVYDGYGAVDAVKNVKFDIALLDVKMPGMDGVDTLKAIKKIDPKIAVVMITAFADEIIYKEELKNAELRIIEKPIDVDKLLETIEEIC
jgi:DNA-binding NtrC family response regulator